MEEENGTERMVPWRSIALLMLASALGMAISWNVWLSQQVSELQRIAEQHRTHLNEHDKVLGVIQNVGTDDRFRRSDFNKEKEIIDIRFRTLERQCEACCEKPRLR